METTSKRSVALLYLDNVQISFERHEAQSAHGVFARCPKLSKERPTKVVQRTNGACQLLPHVWAHQRQKQLHWEDVMGKAKKGIHSGHRPAQ